MTVTRKTNTFLNLLKRTNLTNNTVEVLHPTSLNKFTFSTFRKHPTTVSNIIYIFETLTQHRLITSPSSYLLRYNILYFYARLSPFRKTQATTRLTTDPFLSYVSNNILVFNKPTKQLFLTVYKDKPVFIFTAGLMRIVMNEKRKSSKKLYKVAVSLVKLSVILLNQKRYFTSCYLKLQNVGMLRQKILRSIQNSPTSTVIKYIVLKIRKDLNAQKLNTRRSIKKYVKKRFNLNT